MMLDVALCFIEFDISTEDVYALETVASIYSVFFKPGAGTQK
jgi:hypothetical protein